MSRPARRRRGQPARARARWRCSPCWCWSAPAAWAHAQLLGTSPASGATVQVQPQEVIFEFNQDVGGTLGAVRVYDAQGDEVDDLDVSHPDGNEHWMGVGLKPHLPDGTYTGTYRVISADTHIVYGGLVFSIGHPGARPEVHGRRADRQERERRGHQGRVRRGAGAELPDARADGRRAGFLFFAWMPGSDGGRGLARRAGRSPSRVFASRLAGCSRWRSCSGVIVSVLGVLLQGASAAGVSLWASLKGSILESTLESRFGRVWGLRAIDWVLLGALLLSARAMR